MHIILLRGLAREAAHWAQFPHHLQHALGSEWKIHCIDFPGCGVHYQQPALDSIHSMTDFARTQIAGLKITEPIYVVGISMGGMVALNWAQQFPAQIAGAALINSSAGDHPLHWRLRPQSWPAMIAAILLPMRLREALVLRHVSNDHTDFDAHLQHWISIQQQRPVSRSTIITMLVAAAHFRPQSTWITKGLIVASEADRFVSHKASIELAQRLGWPLTIHPTAGHDIPLDDVQWLCAQVTNWIQLLPK
ncbi:MAG TPA: alpha/beta hydrolase [Cellvibrio sp.]|nr:alpha/beta hydrolase [Cellvibrio sp.]